MKRIISIFLVVLLLLNSSLSIKTGRAEDGDIVLTEESFIEENASDTVESDSDQEDCDDSIDEDNQLSANENKLEEQISDDIDVCNDDIPSETNSLEQSELKPNTEISDLAVIETGSCGDNASYTVYEDFSMVINGTGKMYDYDLIWDQIKDEPIGANTPWNSLGITSVLIEGVTCIGTFAFYGCDELLSIVVSDSVNTIRQLAIADCPKLLSISIGNSVSSFSIDPEDEVAVFENCPSLMSITVSTENETYDSRDNCNALIERNSDRLIAGCNATIIPETVKSIYAFAFLFCKGLKSIYIPTSVLSIGGGVFSYCESLTSIKVSPDNPVYDSRKNCNAIIETATNKLLYGCSTTTIPSSVTSMALYAFEGSSIKSIKIPSNFTTVEDGSFYGCTKLTDVTIPNSIEYIGDEAFRECTSLVSIHIPDSVSHIGWHALMGCSSLESITVSQGNKIYDSRENCNAIIETATNKLLFGCKNTIIPASVIDIESEAFYGCSGLQSIDIPDSIHTINADSFRNCSSLKSIYFSNSVDFIGSGAFADGVKYIFTECEEEKSNWQYYNEDDEYDPWRGEADVHYGLSRKEYEEIATNGLIIASGSCGENASYTIYDDLSMVISGTGEMYDYESIYDQNISDVIGSNAPWTSYNVTKLTINGGITSIGDFAFINCSNLSNVLMPDTLLTIGKYAFRNCSSLTSIIIPDSVTTVSADAFWGCSIEVLTVPISLNLKSLISYENLKHIHFTPGTGIGRDYEYSSPFGGSQIKNLSVLIDEGVKYIGTYLFNECRGITSVNIPSTVKTIAAYAFYECKGVGSIFVPSTVETIEQYALTGISDIYTDSSKRKNDWNATWCDSRTTVHYNVSESEYYSQFGDTYNIVFDGNGSTSGSTKAMNALSCGKSYSLTANGFAKAGYVFTGWNTKQDGSGTDFVEQQEVKNLSLYYGTNITLYAQWRPITYTVCYHSNNNENKTYDQPFEYGTEQELAGKIFACDGELLIGWNTKANGLGKHYEPNQTVKDLSIIDGATVNLYAIYEYRNTTPYSDPEPGIVDKGTKISLYCDTPESSIYYTLDGTEPSRESTLYEDVIEVKEDTLIRAFAVSGSLPDSKVVDLSYTVFNGTDYGTIDPEDVAYYEELERPEGFWTSRMILDTADESKEVRYTGKPITLSFRVYDGTTLLERDRDYTVKYTNNTKAAAKDAAKAPTVTITGKGNYTGSLTKTFDILPALIDEETGVILLNKDTFVANNKVQKPSVTVEYNGTKLKNNTDYTVSYGNDQSKEEGTYSLIVSGINNYEGSVDVSYKIITSAQSLKPIASLKISGIKNQSYTGDELVQEVLIKDGTKKLVENEDFSIEYVNNINAGTAYVLLTGIEESGYTGSITKSFKINPIKLNAKNCEVFGLDEAYDYDPENAVTPDAALQCNGNTLTLNEDYIVSFKNNAKAGTAAITFKGINNYSGSFSKSFKINKLDLEDHMFDFEPAYEYQKGGTKPIPITELALNKDYTLSYKNNKKTGEASVTVKGKGNYVGSLSFTFDILVKDIEEVRIEAKDKVYSAKANGWQSKPVLTDDNGKKLVAGTDYEKEIVYECDGKVLSKSDVLPTGSVVTVTAKGKGNYEGMVSTTYRIVSLDIAKATVSIPIQYYTGRPIVLNKSDITVKLGKDTLKLNDYEIVPGSYVNNTAKGTAKLTIKGKGNYGGTKTVSFKIVQKSLGITIKFNPNGATSGSMKDQMIYKDTKINKNTFKRVVGGVTHEFLGFNTKYDGSGDWYQPGDMFSYDPDKAGTFVILWAQWK